mgnify:FL=1
MNKYLMSCVMAAVTAQTQAQTEFANATNLWHEGAVNELFNIRYHSINPTRLTYNQVQTTGEALIGYDLTRGNFHDAGTSGHANNINVYLGGLKHFDRVDVSGFLHYINTNYKNQEWNSTLFLNPNNPFVLADSVASDGNTESFAMGAALSYRFTPKIKGGLGAGLTVGSMSDQTDPRPKTNTSRFNITAGSDAVLSTAWTLGLAARVELFSSNLSYTVVNPLNNHRYFLMKGMGDYFRRSSGDESGYRRDYKGTTFSGELSATFKPSDSPFQNLVLMSGSAGSEKATDGGSAYTFKGGDYHFYSVAIKDRLMFSYNEHVLHNIIIGAEMSNGNSDWYDQKKITDTEHGNISYYKVLNKTRVHKQGDMAVTAEYRFDRLTNGQRDFYASLFAVLANTTIKHYNDNGLQKQQWTNLALDLTAGKRFALGKGILNTQLTAGYVMPMKDREFATGTNVSGTDDITGVYVTRRFEYASAKRLRIGGSVDYNFLVAKAVRLGLFGKVLSTLYKDDAQYCASLKSTSLTHGELGVYMNF